MFNIGPQELIVVLVVALVIVGPKRLPEMARLIGRGLNEFRKVQDEVRDMVKFDLGVDPVEEPPTPTPHRERNLSEEPPDDELVTEALPAVSATSGNGHGGPWADEELEDDGAAGTDDPAASEVTAAEDEPPAEVAEPAEPSAAKDEPAGGPSTPAQG